jgi:membrane-associated phospholipid phosphatase
MMKALGNPRHPIIWTLPNPILRLYALLRWIVQRNFIPRHPLSIQRLWEAKYKYGLVRPETFINKYINKEWTPLIQTPLFPEYPSGHSVVSGSAATVLTHFFGENYAYTDSIGAQFGLPIRQFKSFNEAAKEASISRLYGGIHYTFALTNENL